MATGKDAFSPRWQRDEPLWKPDTPTAYRSVPPKEYDPYSSGRQNDNPASRHWGLSGRPDSPTGQRPTAFQQLDPASMRRQENVSTGLWEPSQGRNSPYQGYGDAPPQEYVPVRRDQLDTDPRSMRTDHFPAEVPQALRIEPTLEKHYPERWYTPERQDRDGNPQQYEVHLSSRQRDTEFRPHYNGALGERFRRDPAHNYKPTRFTEDPTVPRYIPNDPFPYVRDEIRPAQEKKQEGMIPQRKPQSRSAYLFVRFATQRHANTDVVAHTCVLSKPETSRGRFVGIARKIDESGPSYSGDEAFVVFVFESNKDAQTFFEYEPRMRQPDFPPPSGLCDIWTVERYYNPENEGNYNTFMLSEVKLTDPARGYNEYKTHFIQPFADLLLEYGAHPFVVQNYGNKMLRHQLNINHFTGPDSFVTLHLFKSLDHYRDIKKDQRYWRLKHMQSEMAWEMTTVFSLNPTPCP